MIYPIYGCEVLKLFKIEFSTYRMYQIKNPAQLAAAQD